MIHNHNIRNRSNIHIPHYKTKLYEQSVEYRGIHLYNKLPEDIKTAKNFKKNIIQFPFRKKVTMPHKYTCQQKQAVVDQTYSNVYRT